MKQRYRKITGLFVAAAIISMTPISAMAGGQEHHYEITNTGKDKTIEHDGDINT